MKKHKDIHVGFREHNVLQDEDGLRRYLTLTLLGLARQMLNSLLEIWEVWETMEVEIQNVVHLVVVSDAMILRVFRLSKEVLLHLEIIMQNSLEMVGH